MDRKLVLVAVCVAGVAWSSIAGASDFMFGMEQGIVSADIKSTFGPEQGKVRHSWTAASVDWRINKILMLNMAVGGMNSAVDTLPEMSAQDDKYLNYFATGLTLTQELDTGGGMLIGLSYNASTVDWKGGSIGTKYRHQGTTFKIAYAFKQAHEARPYTGLSYNTYASTLYNGSTAVSKHEYENRLNLVAGVRAQTESILGFVEATLGGEAAIKLGLEFGF